MKADFSLGQFSDIDIFYTRISSLPLNQGILLVFWLVSFDATPYFEHGTSPEYDLDIENTKKREGFSKEVFNKDYCVLILFAFLAVYGQNKTHYLFS